MRMRLKDALCVIPIGRILLAAAASGAVLATNAFAQSAREVRDGSPYVAIENEAPPKLIVDPTPLAAGLAHGIVWIQYHAENVRIVPAFGAGALNVSPRECPLLAQSRVAGCGCDRRKHIGYVRPSVASQPKASPATD